MGLVIMSRAEIFSEYRPLMFSIAYRMLGSVMDAEDMVQESYLRFEQAVQSEVQSPKSFLATIITRLCIDHLRLAHVQRESYVGPWLPEPLQTGPGSGFIEHASLSDSLSIAFLVLLESLSPVERAVFLLREVFDYDYDQVARIVEKSEANCRQIVHRAQQHITSRRPRFAVSREQRDRLLSQFIQTCQEGDMDGFVALLADDIIMVSDGGGKTAAALKPIYGATKVGRYIFGILTKMPANFVVTVVEINGQPALIGHIDHQIYNVLTMDITGDRITGIQNILNPDKLSRLPV
jgi:RNA polymerase sigma-70 factor, ECF subfamily